MTKQPTFEVYLELEDERCRAHFVIDGLPRDSWVGDWETSHADLAKNVAREAQGWAARVLAQFAARE